MKRIAELMFAVLFFAVWIYLMVKLGSLWFIGYLFGGAIIMWYSYVTAEREPEMKR